jgi:hypothetical protein
MTPRVRSAASVASRCDSSGGGKDEDDEDDEGGEDADDEDGDADDKEDKDDEDNEDDEDDEENEEDEDDAAAVEADAALSTAVGFRSENHNLERNSAPMRNCGRRRLRHSAM